MSRSAGLISSLFIAVFSLIGAVGNNICAQEIFMKEEWTKCIYNPKPLFTQDTLTICFMGDMMMHTQQIEAAYSSKDSYDFSPYFSLIGTRIKEADIAVANMEFTLAGKPYSGYPCFSAPDSYAKYLADCGFDVFLAANNHILDLGSEGAGRTAEIYRSLSDSHRIRFTGIAGNEEERMENYPLFIRRKGISIALVNFTYGTNLGYTEHWPKTNYMGKREEIHNALMKSGNADFTIALPHWGPEYQLTHSATQEDMAKWLTDNGADAIIGTHPHVVQDTTHIGKIPVIYSLGNAVSNMSAANTQLELMVTMKITRNEVGDLNMEPLELTWLWCSRPGGFGNSYTIIPVEGYIGKQNLWQGQWDYDKMVSTYERIRKTVIYNE